MDSDSSLHSNCPCQIVYAKFDLKGFTLLLMKELCGISPGKIPIIKKVIDLFDWKPLLNNLDVKE